MTRKIILRPSLSDKRQPLLPSSPLDRRQSPFRSSSFDQRRTPLLAEQQSWSSRGGNRRFTEVAGGTTAECAAIACCAPCGIANLLVLTMYKVPVGLCRKALRHQRRRRLLGRQISSEQMIYRCGCECDGADFEMEALGDPMMMVESMEMDKDMMELEKEMWNKFYGTGFWRSPSQRTVG